MVIVDTAPGRQEVHAVCMMLAAVHRGGVAIDQCLAAAVEQLRLRHHEAEGLRFPHAR